MVTVKVGAVCRPKAGEAASGDIAVFWQDQRTTLVAVIDGLGSGVEAARASQAAATYLADHRDGPLSALVTGCHAAMCDTRGAVLALMRIEHHRDRMTFVGVGNIEFSAASAMPMQPFSTNGLVGQRLPNLSEFTFPCQAGDVLALCTDGISKDMKRRGGIAGLPALDWSEPQRVAQQLVDRFGQENDDAAAAVVMIGVPPLPTMTWSRG